MGTATASSFYHPTGACKACRARRRHAHRQVPGKILLDSATGRSVILTVVGHINTRAHQCQRRLHNTLERLDRGT
eukprot:15467909-Alexandrium_andersonii.AAC.1